MGPTASGKSAMGIHLAQKLDGVIINADTMQCYADCRIITARPDEAETAQAPHRLYGIWDAFTHGSAAMWHRLAITEIDAAHATGKLPILLGGTGMYIKSLIEGMAEIPPIPPLLHEATKARWRDDPEAFYAEFNRRDPVMAAKLEPNDQQRLIRAWEVLEHTGTSLDQWQKSPTTPTYRPEQCLQTFIDIERDMLYARINQRFDKMVEMGVLEEVKTLLNTLSNANETIENNTLPLFRAIGLPELMAHLYGECRLEDAIEKAKTNTRRYAKRQLTWIRNQCEGALPIPHDLLKNPQKTDEFMESLAKRLDRRLLNL